jgi:hypothetical protein
VELVGVLVAVTEVAAVGWAVAGAWYSGLGGSGCQLPVTHDSLLPAFAEGIGLPFGVLVRCRQGPRLIESRVHLKHSN